MTKIEFLLSLNEKLSALPQDEVRERLNFYSEMIEDRMEEGLSEEEAVAAVGDVGEIAESIMAELSQNKSEPSTEAESDKKPKRRMSGMEIALLIIGFPLWFPLLIAAFVVALSLCVFVWAAIISLWAAFVSIGAGIIYFLAKGIYQIFGTHALTGVALIGAALICTGISVFAFYGCVYATKYTAILTKKCFLGIIKLFRRREASK